MLLSIPEGPGPGRHRLALSIAEAIRIGRLHAGTRLPASRDLARQLGVSRGLVTDAYGQLAAQGFLLIEPRRAPLVAAGAPAPPDDRIRSPQAVRPRYDFTPTSPDASLFPRRRWRRAIDDALKTTTDAELDYGDPFGAAVLREQLAERLGRVRGAVTTPHRIVVVQGFSQGLDVLCAVLGAAGRRRLAVEDPALDDAIGTARLAGMEIRPVPVDAEGIDVTALAAVGADAVLVTPAHQFPTGVVMSSERRRELLGWAEQTGALVIEDDYDAEFRHAGAPLGTLQGLAPDRVAYVGTASKVLVPALRLGWLALPPELVAAAADAKWWRDSGSPILDQVALAAILADGSYDRAQRRALRAYRARRDALIGALADRIPSARISGTAAGLHVVAEIPGADEAAVVAAAARRRIAIRGIGTYAIAEPRRPRPAATLVLGYGRLSADAIPTAVDGLARAVAETCGA